MENSRGIFPPGPAGFRWIAAAALLFGGIAAACLSAARLYREEAVDPASLALPAPTVFTDRNGEILRVLPDGNGDRVLPVPLSSVPTHVVDAFLVAEDGRFRSHRGFDPLAIARAAVDSIRAGRFVSGASTITQQVARMTRPRERSIAGKIREIARAVRIERILSKDEILMLYLNRVPLGRNLRGVEAASRAYFGKSVADLSPFEGAVLASLPSAPGRLDPDGPMRDELIARARRLATRMETAGRLAPGIAEAARAAVPRFAASGLPFRAPHLVDRMLASGPPGPGVRRTTIDLRVQTISEETLRAHAARLGTRDVSQGAAIVVRNDNRETLAYVGSIRYGPLNGGYCDGVRTRRSAGSTVKPFLYARAIEAGRPDSTLIEDTARRYRAPRGDFSPDNFNRVQYGPVTMRVALANSLNLSAVGTLNRLGPRIFFRTLSDMELLRKGGAGPEDLGLGLAVGNAEVTLEGLAAAYASLVGGGAWRPLKYAPGDGSRIPLRRVFFPETAYLVTDILSDPAARLVVFGAGFPGGAEFPYALKTGTSTHYRDGWAVASTAEFTVAVWTGNFDGRPTSGITGGWAAAPIAGEILERLHRSSPPSPFRRPPGIVSVKVCGISGMSPGPGCVHVTTEKFLRGAEPAEECSLHASRREAHVLPNVYARWVSERARRGAAGRFILEDGLDPAPFDPHPSEEIQAEIADPGLLPNQARLRLADEDPGPGSPPGTAARRGRNDALPQVEIAYPLPRDRFVLDRSQPAPSIRLDAVIAARAPYVDWYIDGRHYAQVGPPYSVYWTLFPGLHEITLSAPGMTGDSVRIGVE